MPDLSPCDVGSVDDDDDDGVDVDGITDDDKVAVCVFSRLVAGAKILSSV